MYVDTNHWLSQCERCHISKGDYTEPKTQQGSLVAQQPLELLCIDFTKADVQREVRRTYLFSLMPSQNTVKLLLLPTKKPLQLPKYWWKNGLVCLGFLPGSIVIKADPLTMKSFPTFAKCMVSSSQQQHHTTHMATRNVNSLTVPYLD